MNGYLVDTNIPSELTREKPDERVAVFLARTPKDRIFLSVLTLGEICKGIATLPPSQKRTALQTWLDEEVRQWFSGRILPITAAIAERWGYLSAAAKQLGMTIPVVDALIAATALDHQLTLVTRNTKDFVPLGVEIFNPWEQPLQQLHKT